MENWETIFVKSMSMKKNSVFTTKAYKGQHKALQRTKKSPILQKRSYVHQERKKYAG